MRRKGFRLPHLIRWLLRCCGDSDLQASMEEDLEFGFTRRARDHGRFRAFAWCTGQTLLLLASCSGEAVIWRMNMVHSYIRSAWRHLARRKLYTVINITGLALGLACFILIGLWVRDELSFDDFHQNRDRIFRVLNRFPDGRNFWNTTCAIGPALLDEYSEVEEMCRLYPWAASMVRYHDKQLDERNIHLTDPGFFRMFSFPFIQGNPDTALDEKYSIVLTENAARRIFGDEDALGKVVQCDRLQGDFKVTGIIASIPAASHLQFDIVARIDFLGEDRLSRWEEWVGPTYIMLKPDVTAAGFQARIAGLYRRYLDSEETYVPALQALRDVYLLEGGQGTRLWKVALFSGIALFILLMACINYMNLSTAQYSRRAREVGIRKVIGADRSQIVRQYLGEAFLLSFLALCVSVLLAQAALPFFNSSSGKQLTLLGDLDLGTLLALIITAAATGLLAGCYPALFLSSFRPAAILRDRISGKRSEAGLRRFLIVIQFAIAICLIVCTLVVADQLRFIGDLDLGLDRENIVVLNNSAELKEKYDTFKARLLQEPAILQITTSATLPLSVGQSILVDWEGNTGDPPSMDYTVVDYDFFETFKMQLIQGRGFSRDFPSDERSACILNETAMRAMQLDNPIGTTVYMNHPAWDDSLRATTVIGVVKDFHSRSLHSPVRPFVFRMYRPYYEFVFIRIDGRRTRSALERIEAVYREQIPGLPYAFQFLEDIFQQQYIYERQSGRLFLTFSWISVLIACLGLFGLSAFTVEQRTKEIGIRKALGASIFRIMVIITRDFLRWVALANLLAWPVAWLVMDKWLQDFAYKITPGLHAFLAALACALGVALVALIYHVLRAARANPVDALRYE